MIVLRSGTAGSGAVTPSEADFVRTLLEVKGRVEGQYVRELDPEIMRLAAVEGMLRLTTDPNTVYVPPERAEQFADRLDGVFVGIGVNIEAVDRDVVAASPDAPSDGILVTRVLPGSPALASGVQVDDILVSADGVDLRPLNLREAQQLITGPAGTTVDVGIARGDEAVSLTIERARVISPIIEGIARAQDGSPRFVIEPQDLPVDLTVGSGELPRVVFVRLTDFAPEATQRLLNAIANVSDPEAFILDLRQNPGGQLRQAVELASLFLPEGALVTFEDGRSSARTLHRVAARPDDAPWLKTVPLVVLVDGNSASASEVVSGALSHHGRATLVGTSTFGKGSVQDIMGVGGGRLGTLKLTTAYYHLPDGRIVDRSADGVSAGVLVDVDVPLDEASSFRPSPDGPMWPTQVWAAYEVLLANLLEVDAIPMSPVAPPDVVEVLQQ